MVDHDIIPPSLAIKAMRDSGYRDAAHAIAELVDNAIQAKAKTVEIICTDRIDLVEERTRRRVDRIAVFDDGTGMDKDVLQLALQFGNGTHLDDEQQNGIGKFGMGLPNSSISQCQRVDVWSWQERRVLHSYLDVEEILRGKLRTVPVPKAGSLPPDIKKLIEAPIQDSGTLVVWSNLDRVRWKGSKALLDNSEFLIGRMYRYFLENDAVRIRLAAYAGQPAGGWEEVQSDYVKPNDPLYLMRGTSCPELPDPFNNEPMFEEFGPSDEIEIQLPNRKRKHTVNIKYSIVKTSIRKKLGQLYPSPGSSPPGKHAGRNIGISIVRAGRELEMSSAHVIGYDPVERWWGIEVSFPPALDQVFGVTNNKQAATAFGEYNLDEDAAADDMQATEYLEHLRETQDPRWVIYEVSRRIHANLTAMRGQLRRMSEGARKRSIDEVADPAEIAATKATSQRKLEGYEGASDRSEDLPNAERIESLKRELELLGTEPGEAQEIAATHVNADIKYVFQQQPYHGPSFFSVSSRGGSIVVTVNKEHPVAKYLIGLLEQDGEGPAEDRSNQALVALKLMLCAWARLEDETQNDKQRQRYTDTRDQWGRMTRAFLDTAYEK